MKNLSLPSQVGPFENWVKECFDAIELASTEDMEAIVSEFSFTGVLTKRRTIDAGAATLPQLRDYVCTMVDDIRKRGQKRSVT